MKKYMKFFSVVTLFAVILAGCGTNDSSTNATTRKSMNQQYDFIGRDYVDTTTTVTTLKHRSTGCYYGMLASDSSASGVGGMSIIYAPDGKPLCDKKE